MPKFGIKNALFRYFWATTFKKLLSHLKSAHSNLPKYKILQKKHKCLYLGPKMRYLCTFGLEFEKAIAISEISTLEFLKNESLTHTVSFVIGSAFSKGSVVFHLSIKYLVALLEM